MISATRSFGIALACVAGLALGLKLWVAAGAWFSGDDFHFLYWVQTRHWSWREVFLPSYARDATLAYQPLGLETYFYASFAAFGWNAFGYYLGALGLQVATAAVVYRIARQEGFDRRITWVVAAIVCAGGPLLTSTSAVAEHSHLAAGLFYALCISFFLAYRQTRRLWLQVGSSLALVCGLLSNDVVSTAAPLLLGLAFARAPAGSVRKRALEALRWCWPQLLISALFIDFRLWGVPSRHWFGGAELGFHVVSNSAGNLVYASGGGVRFVLLLALSAAAVFVLRRERATRSALGPAWLGLALLPFAVLVFPAPRFALTLLPAVALCLGVVASVLVDKLSSPRLQAAALIGLVVLCVPWEDAVERALRPGGREQRQAYAVARSTLPLDDRACVTVLCGEPGLANSADCAYFRKLTSGGDLFRAVVPARDLAVEIVDARLGLAEAADGDCLTYELRSDRRLAASARVRSAGDGEGQELSQLQ